ncbi:MAG: hypothetical protein HYT79_04265 [Elusimicrobia bacterium]|nr:hypothetical protein [Elusimicrobiota bacterium]
MISKIPRPLSVFGLVVFFGSASLHAAVNCGENDGQQVNAQCIDVLHKEISKICQALDQWHEDGLFTGSSYQHTQTQQECEEVLPILLELKSETPFGIDFNFEEEDFRDIWLSYKIRHGDLAQEFLGAMVGRRRAGEAGKLKREVVRGFIHDARTRRTREEKVAVVNRAFDAAHTSLVGVAAGAAVSDSSLSFILERIKSGLLSRTEEAGD